MASHGVAKGEYKRSKKQEWKKKEEEQSKEERGVWSVWKERSWISYAERVHLSSRLFSAKVRYNTRPTQPGNSSEK